MFDKNYQPERFSIIPPLSSLFSSGVRKPKKDMYEKYVYNRQKEIKKIQQDNPLPRTYEVHKKIEKLRNEIEYYTKKNEDMLREGATRSKYSLVERGKKALYDAKRSVLGLAGRYSPDSSDSD